MRETNLIHKRRRLRRVMEHIGRHLAEDVSPAPGATLELRELAQVACWSPEHFDRVYRLVIGESPMGTVRRLRLMMAAVALRRGVRLIEAAERAGYGSTQAFGRAFARQHGLPPSAWLGRQSSPRPAPLWQLVYLPTPQPCYSLPYRGARSGVESLFDATVDALHRTGSARSQWHVFGLLEPDAALTPAAADESCRVTSAVLAQPLSCAPRGMDRLTLAAGWYGRINALRSADHRHLDDALRDAGWQRTDGAMARHYATDPAYTAPQERREWLYLPLARRDRKSGNASHGQASG